MTYTNERLGLAITVEDDGSYKVEATRPSFESRILNQEAAQWEQEILNQHFASHGAITETATATNKYV